MAATKTKTTSARNVDDYLSRVPEDSRVALEKLRRTIKSMVPDAVEDISYQIPTFKYQGRMLVSYAAFAEHCSFFPGAAPIIGSALVLLVAAAIASLLPAARAARVDVVQALRSE